MYNEIRTESCIRRYSPIIHAKDFLLKGMQNTVKKYLQQRSLEEKYLKSLNSMAYT